MSARAMCAVIEFPQDRVRPLKAEGIDGAGKVIIFPGVQIERLMYDLAERLPAARIGSSAQTRVTEFDFLLRPRTLFGPASRTCHGLRRAGALARFRNRIPDDRKSARFGRHHRPSAIDLGPLLVGGHYE